MADPTFTVKLFDCNATENDMIDFMTQRSIDPGSVTKVVVYGNTGVGKSFFANHFVSKSVGEVPRDLFHHKFQPGSCTRVLERALVILPAPASPLLVYNIPGLIEVEQDRLRENKKIFLRCISEMPTCRTALIFVIGSGCGGRIPESDVTAFREAKKVLRAVDQDIAFVFNKIGGSHLDDDDYAEWLHEQIRFCHCASHAFSNGVPVTCFFFPYIPVLKLNPSAEYLQDRQAAVGFGNLVMGDALRFAVGQSKVLCPDLKAEMILSDSELKDLCKAEGKRQASELVRFTTLCEDNPDKVETAIQKLQGQNRQVWALSIMSCCMAVACFMCPQAVTFSLLPKGFSVGIAFAF